jgi:hypothetical protein
MQNLILKLFSITFSVVSLCLSPVSTKASGESSEPPVLDTLESRLRELDERARRLGLFPSSSVGQKSAHRDVSPYQPPVPTRAPSGFSESSPLFPSGKSGEKYGNPISTPKPAPKIQKKLGDYYILPFMGLSLPSELSYSLSDTWEVDSEVGHVFGLIGGKSFGRWFGEIHFEYGQQKLDAMSHPDPFLTSMITSVSGDSEIINFGARVGFLQHISTNFWLQMGLGAGVVGREDTLSYSTVGGWASSHGERKTTYTYDGLVNLGFSMTEYFHGRFGYRYLATGENGYFGPLRHHLIELGLGADF